MSKHDAQFQIQAVVNEYVAALRVGNDELAKRIYNANPDLQDTLADASVAVTFTTPAWDDRKDI